MRVFAIIPYEDQFLDLYRKIIEPTIRSSGFTALLAGQEVKPGKADDQIHDFIKTSNFCIADLTGSNPNVMYEIALAHSLQKPVILITSGETKDIPFDIRQYRTIKYDLNEAGYVQLKEKLFESIRSIAQSEQSTVELLRNILVPQTLTEKHSFVVAANPLSYRAAFRARGGWTDRPLITCSDHVGIRGLMQSFGWIYGFEVLPELINPDDFDDKVLLKPMNLYTIGSPKANRWTGIMFEQFFSNKEPLWDFKPDPESKDILNPKVILRRNKTEYLPSRIGNQSRLIWDFGIIVRGPHPHDSSFMLMALAGRGALGTEAACLAVSNPKCAEKLSKELMHKEIEIQNHKNIFCAIVSIETENYKTKIDSFDVHEIIKY